MVVKVAYEKIARSAGLHYVKPEALTWIRKPHGKSYRFINSRTGRKIGKNFVSRFKSLAIPPSWKEVKLCPQPNGHLQAVGLDLKGKTQYLYHPSWAETRVYFKNLKIAAFGQHLPALRQKIAKDLKLNNLSKAYVTAVALRLMDISAIRIGNEESARRKAKKDQTYGLTTLKAEHVKVKGPEIRLVFKGKSGVDRDITVVDPVVAETCKNLVKLDGEELFAYQDEFGQVFDLKAHDLNDYILEATGEPFTAKDFRTWRATVIAAECLNRLGPLKEQLSERRYASRRNEALRCASAHLGNTMSMCKSHYVNSQLFLADQNGQLARYLKACVKTPRDLKHNSKDLSGIEKAVLKVYQASLKIKPGK